MLQDSHLFSVYASGIKTEILNLGKRFTEEELFRKPGVPAGNGTRNPWTQSRDANQYTKYKPKSKRIVNYMIAFIE